VISHNVYISQYTGAQIDETIGAVLAGKAVVITNCPNCGAPVNGRSKCEYCGTAFSSGEEEMTLRIDGAAVARAIMKREG